MSLIRACPVLLAVLALLTGPLSSAELPSLWADLAGGDAVKAYRAIGRLAAAPELTVPWLRERLRPVAAADPQHLARLLADLDSNRFAVREQAMAELEKLGELAEPALQKALEGQPALEFRRRVEQLIEKLRGPITHPDHLRVWRALEVLEHVGTPAAKQVLERMAQGAPESRLTQEAKESLQRLGKRPTAGP